MRTLAGLLVITNTAMRGGLASEHLVELVDELGVPVMDRQPNLNLEVA